MPYLTNFGQYSGYSRIGDEHNQEIESEENIICYGYKTSILKNVIFNIFAVSLLGIPYLILHWYCQYAAFVKYNRCSLEEAEVLLIKASNLIQLLWNTL